MKKILATLACLVVTAFGASAAQASNTITDIVAGSGGEFDRNGRDYDILLTAVLTAGLEGALADPSASLTVFAPNDRAFGRLARDLGYKGSTRNEAAVWGFLVEALTDLGGGDPIPVLTDILSYHVVPDAVDVFGFVKAVIFRADIPTLLEGATLRAFFFGLIDNEPDLRNPRLTLPVNIEASNGFIHTLNRVLIPVDLP